MKTRTPKGDLVISFQEAGTHVLAIETTSSISSLKADKFNAYLKEEGLTPIQKYRLKTGTSNDVGREIYSRRGKALIQVGPVGAQTSDYVSQPIGMTLEITPVQNPYTLKSGEPFTSIIHYRGETVEGVTIGLISLNTDAGLVEVKKSDAQGSVTFDRPEIGQWMLHAVWSDHMEDTTSGDFDTVFSSLSFGFNE